MRRILTAVLILLGTSALPAAPQPAIRCSDLHQPSASFDINPQDELRFVPMEARAFHSAFRLVKKWSYGRYAFFFARKDRGESPERVTTLMIGASVDDRKFFGMLDDKGEWPVYEDDDEGVLRGLPEIVRLVNDADRSLFRVTFESSMQSHNTTANTETTYIVAVQPQPRIVTSIGCNKVGGGGKCGGDIHTRGDALECNWLRSLRDFTCTSTRAYSDWLSMAHPGERRFTLIGGKSLPVTKSGVASFRSLQELGQALQRGDLSFHQGVVVDGIGLLKRLDLSLQGVHVYAATGLNDDMDLRVFAVPHEGVPVSVPLHNIVDGHEPEEQQRAADDNSYTPTGEDWSVARAGHFNLGSAEIFQIVLHDGKGRGLFWVAVDQTVKPPLMSVLRMAADIGSYGGCYTFIYPASASAVTIAEDHADLTIESHSRRGQDGEAVVQEDDPEVPCHVRATVTWNHEKGFNVLTSDVPCQPNEVRLGVVIDALGHLSTTPLRYEKDQ